MRRRGGTAIAGLIGLSVWLTAGAGPAFAFQEVPIPPSLVPGEAPRAPEPPALALGEPAVPVQPPKQEDVEIFGYTVPKLDFGLELLYGGDQARFGAQEPPPALEGARDVGVLGQIKRRF